ncbi:hypothetical protein IS481_12035 [Caldimonas thermodepolymerans]|uniref:Uncharacterized protein n=1 Tax=Caldimonas thermodepolymerans TaxID=215580 RepID=A0A2S5T965_9BURK|nr:portal protein [Caldimonas thermodepolymerans]PPE71472.1 hypothetical protein C1702_00260 [Caldimonas thermodepolymerans]QPC30499.1 hypothetical protein IS481_12035 [Caldimonas thermodepolymerans]RDI02915.1 head-to-tail connecting protein [Caldimonas thermodepolymerans]
MTQASLQDRYAELTPERDAALRRARGCAAITVPAVLPPEGHTYQNNLPANYTSFGARCVTNLASKLLLALLPPGASSFRLNVPTKLLVEAGANSAPPEIVQGLAQVENLVNAKIEALGWRRPTFVTLLNLIVTGNLCEYILPDGRLKQYRLDQFVCVRDFAGEVQEIVTCEVMKARSLPEALKHRTQKRPEEDVKLYTQFKRLDERRYAIRQDLDESVVLPEEHYHGIMPANALTWDLVPSENYGRSHVEHNYNDLESLDKVAQGLREITAMASRHLTFVRPNATGGNLRKRIAEARNGAVLSGNIEDVNTLQFQSAGQYQLLQNQEEALKRDLAQAFLLTSALRRDAERVTAYEIRMLVQELESALGGTYSLLASTLQAWRLRKLIAQMRSRRELPDLGDDAVEIVVTTGLEALGRDEQLNRVRAFLELMNSATPFTDEVPLFVKLDEVLTPGAVALGFPAAIRTSAEVEEMKRAQAQQQLMQQVAGAAAGPLATAAVQSEV